MNKVIIIAIVVVSVVPTLGIPLSRSDLTFIPMTDEDYFSVDENNVVLNRIKSMDYYGHIFENIPDRQHSVKLVQAQDDSSTEALLEYENQNLGFRLTYPSSWEIEENSEYGMTRFVSFQPRFDFWITVDPIASSNMTLEQYTDIQSSTDNLPSGGYIIESKDSSLAGNPAHYMVVVDEQRQLQAATFYSILDNKAYVINYVTDMADFNDNLLIVNQVIQSLEIFPSSYSPEEEMEVVLPSAELGTSTFSSKEQRNANQSSTLEGSRE